MTYSREMISMHGHDETRNAVVSDVPVIKQLVRQKNWEKCSNDWEALGALWIHSLKSLLRP